jgi:L-aspartate-alpha-decarboxylase
MLRTFLCGKIHRATVTDGSPDYEGSLGVSVDLIEAAGLHVGEKILVGVINSGARFETYLIPAPAGKGSIVLNGATAHLGKKGDLLTIMAFAQLTCRESLRDIEVCLRAMSTKLYHMGIRGGIARNTLARANETRDWRMYADFAHALIRTARRLYADDDFGVDLEQTAYAFDSTTIDLCLALFPWARFRRRKGAVKLHTLLDRRGNIPSFIHITEGKVHDVNALDDLIPEPGSFYILDRAYLDFARLYVFSQMLAFFVIRAKANFQFRRLYSHSVDRASGVLCDQTVLLTGVLSSRAYPDKLRRIRFFDVTTD